MNPALKQRLIGATVLVALAVIFLPMLLDGSGAREQLDEEITIPERPERPESHLEPVDRSAPEDGAARPAAGGDAASAEGASEAGDDEAVAGNGDASAPSADSGTGGEEASDDTAADVDAGWVVQVGSFRRETNALVLRDRLRQQGFDADTERARADGRAVWRVLVGPVAERAEGESLKRRIEDLRGEQALLMTYP